MDEVEPQQQPLPAPGPPSHWERWLLVLTAIGTAAGIVGAAATVALLLGWR